MACKIYLSWAVTNITSKGISSRSRKKSIPFLPGIATSKNTRLGFKSDVLAKASVACSHSAITSTAGQYSSSNFRRVCLLIFSSSTIMALIISTKNLMADKILYWFPRPTRVRFLWKKWVDCLHLPCH